MKKHSAIIFSLIIIVIIVISTFAAIEIYFGKANSAKKPFYVGVTYCGDSVTEAEQLIDKVRNYTNLFVLDSGTMMNDAQALNETCSYAVESGLNVIGFLLITSPRLTYPPS